MSTEIVEKIEGIGPISGDKLAKAGIRTLNDLRGMEADKVHESTGIATSRLISWQSMATLQQVDGIDSQFSEALVKIGIVDLRSLAEANSHNIHEKIQILQDKGTINKIASIENISLWQERASKISTTQTIKIEARKAAKYDTKLTVLGKQRETAIKNALADTKGRISKQEWAKHFGTNFSAYEDAESHMPRGMSCVVPIVSAREVREARKSSKAYALDRAKDILRRVGKKKPTDKEARELIVQQNKQIQKLNLSLTEKSAEMREYIDQGKEDERDLLLKQILHKNAEMASGRELSGAPQELSTAEKQIKTHQYYHFLNRAWK